MWSIINGLSLYPIYERICLDGRITHRMWLTNFNAGKYVDIILCFISKVLVSCSVLIFNGKLVYIMWHKVRTKTAKMQSDDFERKPLTSVDYGCTDGSSSSVKVKGFKRVNTGSITNHHLSLIKANSSSFNNNDVIGVDNSIKYSISRMSETNKSSDKQKSTIRGNTLASSSLNLIKRNQFKMKYCKKLKKMKLSCIVVLIITLPQICADIGDFIAFILSALECKFDNSFSASKNESFLMNNQTEFYNNTTSFINSLKSSGTSCNIERNFTKTITYIKYGTEILLIISLYNNFIACLLSNRKFRRKIFFFFV